MRQQLVIGNWKMNGTRESVAMLSHAIREGIHVVKNTEVVVAPPFVYLPQVSEIMSNSPVRLAAQNVAAYSPGAYTGEIAASMLCDFNCSYAIIGHSERRTLLGETDTQIAAKFMRIVEADMTPVVCLGETLEQRQNQQTQDVIKRQLDAILTLDNAKLALQKTVFAYEPVWDIGTGITATPDQVQEVHKFIRDKIASLDTVIAAKTRILYGGSVKSSNAKELFAMSDVDGGLIGGASLDAHEFLGICQCNN